MLRVLLICFGLAYSAANAVEANVTTHFERYLIAFHQSDAGGPEDFVGWWSGSCVVNSSPNNEQGKFFLAEMRTPSRACSEHLNYIFGGVRNAPKNYYDFLTEFDRLYIQDYLASSEFASMVSFPDSEGILSVNVIAQKRLLGIKRHSSGYIYLRGQIADMADAANNQVEFVCEFRTSIGPLSITPAAFGLKIGSP